MADDKLVRDLEDNIDRVEKVKGFLDKLYYDREFSTLFNRPSISMLVTGCEFLINNLEQFKQTRERSLG